MPDTIIDSRLRDCRGPIDTTINFNRLLETIDALTARVEALEV